MKPMKMLLTTVLALSTLVACPASKNNRATITTRPGGNDRIGPVGPGGQNPANPTLPSQDRLLGTITGTSDADFTAKVKQLASATLDPQYMGDVSASPNASTGVRFWGDLRTSDNTNLMNMTGTKQIAPATAYLRIDVYDSFFADGSAPEYPITMNGASGTTASGTITKASPTQYTANLSFRDQYGTIQMTGNITQEGSDLVYRGDISFQNTCTYNVEAGQCQTPGMGSMVSLGTFAVKACGFFHCN